MLINISILPASQDFPKAPIPNRPLLHFFWGGVNPAPPLKGCDLQSQRHQMRWVLDVNSNESTNLLLLIFFQSRVKCLLDTITHGFSWLFRPFWICNAKGRNKKGNYWLAIGISFRNALIQPVKWRYLICWFQADRFIPFHFLNVDEFWTFLLLRLSEVGQVNPKCKCPASIPTHPLYA